MSWPSWEGWGHADACRSSFGMPGEHRLFLLFRARIWKFQEKNGTNQPQRLHPPLSQSRGKALESLCPTLYTCPRLCTGGLPCPAPSCVLIPTALCSASVSLFTHLGFLPLYTNQHAVYFCSGLSLRLALDGASSLALCASKECCMAGKRFSP